jgi:ribosomal protein S18 acetylase RimI-like enzyme
MYQAVRKNFEEKISYIASMVPGMTVTDQSSFLSVDCGLPSDTFNVLVLRDLAARAQMLASIDHFTSKGSPLAVWFWESDVDQAGRSVFIQHGLEAAEINTAMYADLSDLQIAPLHIEGLAIKRVVTASDLLQVGNVLAALFGESEEAGQVLAYFQRLCEHPVSMFPAMRYYLGTLHDTVIATGMLFVGSETVGMYDVATSEAYRRRGIGSAMFQHLLEDARSSNHRFCVLQASPDGLGIYVKAGFRSAGAVHVFEHGVVRDEVGGATLPGKQAGPRRF